MKMINEIKEYWKNGGNSERNEIIIKLTIIVVCIVAITAMLIFLSGAVG